MVNQSPAEAVQYGHRVRGSIAASQLAHILKEKHEREEAAYCLDLGKVMGSIRWFTGVREVSPPPSWLTSLKQQHKGGGSRLRGGQAGPGLGKVV